MLNFIENSAEFGHFERADAVLPTRAPALTDNAMRCDVADQSDSANPSTVNSERWLPVPGFEGLYEVSDQGRVRSLDRVIETASRWGGIKTNRLRGRILKPTPSGSRRQHLIVSLGRGNLVFVHRLVLLAFVGPRPDGMECRHLDGNGSNNNLSNLIWGTRLENMGDRTRLGEHNAPRGERNRRAVLTTEQAVEIKRLLRVGQRQSDIARRFGVHRNVVCKIASGHTWAWLR
ncbi:hypothetical protein FRZ32_08435 [Sphingosinicella ginsenosidimutans]|uniref:HNH nuclease domain-containing protein n=1 Tax=Allosphingosinicella ginsenosidimutans TaxID=1176539 RepID=A0A5C6TTF0_9SPHN|nr:hypothetical protein FRZ32_08435 [Sphingosinicella ginsenosidimutans]